MFICYCLSLTHGDEINDILSVAASTRNRGIKIPGLLYSYFHEYLSVAPEC